MVKILGCTYGITDPTSTNIIYASENTTNDPDVSLDEIQYWIGEGTNQCGLVIDWNDGKEPRSLMWGYRWDGEATGQDVVDAIVAEDIRLSGDTDALISELIYDLDNNGSLDENDHSMGMADYPSGVLELLG